MSESLRQIVGEITLAAKIEEKLVEGGGVISPEIEHLIDFELKKLAELRDEKLPVKVDSYAGVMDRLSKLSEMYQQRALQITLIAGALQGIVDKCEDNLKAAMIELEVQELKGHDVKFRLQKSPPSCVIDNEELVHGDYKVERKPVVDKKKILEDLKLGVPVAGCHLEQTSHVRKYLNTKGDANAVRTDKRVSSGAV